MIGIALSQLLVLTLWSSAAAVAWLTLAVQIGFVAGALAIALGGIADSVPSRRLLVIAATVLVFGRSPLLVLPVFVIWGASGVADSAQFSALVTVSALAQRRGTVLTLQTGLGFLLTLVTIRGVPVFAEAFGWQWAFPWLAPGPALGIEALARLRSSKTVGVLT